MFSFLNVPCFPKKIRFLKNMKRRTTTEAIHFQADAVNEISYEGQSYEFRPGETVLETLLRHGVAINYSCRKGVCHGCTSKSDFPRTALNAGSLSTDLAEAGCFLPCKTPAQHGMAVRKHDRTRGEGAAASQEPSQQSERHWPPTNPQLWTALDEGALLKKILGDFYDAVFADPILSPYFQNFTKQRSKEKVYSFYRQLFSGEKVFFGDRPRNSHHWMVISNEVFDYRIELLLSCLRKHGLPEPLVKQWLSYENFYRQDIVKDEPQGRRIGNVVQPAGGSDYEVLDVGACCDGCADFVDEGSRVLFNLRTGELYCLNCHPASAGELRAASHV